MRAIARLLGQQRDLRLLVCANLVSASGDWMLRVGMAYYAYALTGSTMASAAMLLATYLPYVVVSSVAGVFVDRWRRKATMVVTSLLHAAGLAPLLLVQDAGDVWIVYAVTVAQAVLAVFFTPAEQALLPCLVGDGDLTTANALNGQVRELSRLAGPAVGGLAVTTSGVVGLTVLDAATFVLSGCLIAAIRSGERGPTRVEVATQPASCVAGWRQWREGLRFAMTERSVRTVFLFTLAAMTGEGVMGTLFAPFVRDVLHGSGTTFGLIVASQALGGIVGGGVAAGIGRRFSAARMFGVGAIAVGVIDLVMFLYPLVLPALWPAVLCMLLVGVPAAVAMVGYNTVLQRGATDAYRGRVFGALGVVQGVGILAGTAAAALLTEHLGIVAVIVVQGLTPLVGGAVVLVSMRAETGSRAQVGERTLA